MNVVRLDRWLWSVRAYKTRTLATDACKRKWITVNGINSKPSKEIRTGDLITMKKGPIEIKVRVLAILERRISASKVKEFLEDLTPSEVYEELKRKDFERNLGKSLATGKGRPSKKQRRDLEEFLYQGE